MNTIDIIITAIGNSLRSKLRTTLTVLAIFIGAFTLTITSAIGTGVNNYIDTQIGAFGAADVLSITKTHDGSDPDDDGGPTRYDPDRATLAGSQGMEALTPTDLTAIEDVKGVNDVSAARQVNPSYIEHGTGGKFQLTVNRDASLTTPDLATGSKLQVDGDEREILLVSSYVDSLGFDDAEAAVGETVRIGVADHTGKTHEVEARVAGILNKSILASGAALNQALVDEMHRVEYLGMPAGAVHGFHTATAHFDANASEKELNAIKADLTERGYTATTVADKIGIIQTVISGIIGVLNAFAVIALIAAGFGIINTLLMSVQERTREIGLMKAMGMGGGRIYTLFSTEAVFIGFLGSILGVIAAIGVGFVTNGILANGILAELEGLNVLRFEFIPVGTIILVVMLIAFLAGTLPAQRAARQNPIEALRYE